MKHLLLPGLYALLLTGGAALSNGQGDPNGGQHSGKKIEIMLHEHEDRLKDGVRTGELTREEADRLRAKEDIIRVKLDDFRAKNHGYLTNNEESNLEASMDEISGEIYRAKHNAATR